MKKDYFCLIDRSPWPFLSSMSILLVATWLVYYIHKVVKNLGILYMFNLFKVVKESKRSSGNVWFFKKFYHTFHPGKNVKIKIIDSINDGTKHKNMEEVLKHPTMLLVNNDSVAIANTTTSDVTEGQKNKFISKNAEGKLIYQPIEKTEIIDMNKKNLVALEGVVEVVENGGEFKKQTELMNEKVVYNVNEYCKKEGKEVYTTKKETKEEILIPIKKRIKEIKDIKDDIMND